MAFVVGLLTAFTISVVKSSSSLPLLNATLGCYDDSTTRDLPFARMDSNKLTLTSCSLYCYQKRYTYAAAQHSTTCFCADAYGRYGTSTSCTTICAGDATRLTKCGGAYTNTVMKTGFGSSRMKMLYQDTELTSATMKCFSSVSKVSCASNCLGSDIFVGCTALQFDINSRNCCLILDRYSASIGTTTSVGVSVWVAL